MLLVDAGVWCGKRQVGTNRAWRCQVDALNAGYGYLEINCLGCKTHQTIALDIIRRPKATPVHELERYMRCKDCSQVRGYPFKRSQLIALRPAKISADSPASEMWPGDRD